VRDAASWVTTQSPALAIVSDELWQRAHRRLEAARALYPPRQGSLPPVPTSGRYLLTGVLQCGHCGCGLQMSRHSGRRGQGMWEYYVCSRQRTRGILSFAKTVMGGDPPSLDESRLSSVHAEAEQRRTGVVPKSPAKT
jgi:Recombinase zinc beta ribbon domain